MMFFGIILGLALSLVIVRLVTRGAVGVRVNIAWVTASLSILPALFIGIVVGGNFGGALASTLGDFAISIGVVAGLAVVTALFVFLSVLAALAFYALISKARSHDVRT